MHYNDTMGPRKCIVIKRESLTGVSLSGESTVYYICYLSVAYYIIAQFVSL
jgi:hypothetical protein